MDNDEMKGKGKQMGGKVREEAGDITGNEEQEAQGRSEQMKGKAQEGFGDAKEKVKDFGRKLKGD